jgi:serine protease Do
MRELRGLVHSTSVTASALLLTWAAPALAQEMSFSQAQLVRSLLPMVVNITAKAELPAPNAPVLANSGSGGAKASDATAAYDIRTSAGSGFVIDGSGEVATNWHVVNGAFDIVVTFADGTRAKAKLLNASPLVDLAVLKVDTGHKLQAVRWGASKQMQVGDPVLAIGNPLGVGMSVSGGIVSALNRNIMDTPYDDFIQTDAAINHGNSGGPLFNMHGEVIGVNSALISTTSANAGLGFAMPADDARFIFDRLTHKNFRRPGYIGVTLQAVTPEMAQALGMSDAAGSIVAGVIPGSPAEKAGVATGDVVLRYGDETPGDERALLRAIARTEPGTSMNLTVRRAGRETPMPVTIDEWPVMWWESPTAAEDARPHLKVPADLGLTAAPLTQTMRGQYMTRSNRGVVLTGVMPGTDAAQHGLAPGDVITQVNDRSVASPEDLKAAIEAARQDNRPFAVFLVDRKNQPVTAAQLPGTKWLALRLSAP